MHLNGFIGQLRGFGRVGCKELRALGYHKGFCRSPKMERDLCSNTFDADLLYDHHSMPNEVNGSGVVRSARFMLESVHTSTFHTCLLVVCDALKIFLRYTKSRHNPCTTLAEIRRVISRLRTFFRGKTSSFKLNRQRRQAGLSTLPERNQNTSAF